MDPYAHTIIALASHVVGKKIGRQEGITSAVNYLMEMGALTEADLKRANEKFAENEEDL